MLQVVYMAYVFKMILRRKDEISSFLLSNHSPVDNSFESGELISVECDVSGQDSGGNNVGNGDQEEKEGGETNQPALLIRPVRDEDPAGVAGEVDGGDDKERWSDHMRIKQHSNIILLVIIEKVEKTNFYRSPDFLTKYAMMI